jgi:hypothetical protein
MCKCRALARGESNCLWVRSLSFLLLEWSLSSPFIDARGAQGYMHVLRDVLPRKKDLRSPVLSCSWWRITVGGVTPVL